MSAYTREQFEEYKGDEEFLTVNYEYPKGNWEDIDHISYEDYLNTMISYRHMYGED